MYTLVFVGNETSATTQKGNQKPPCTYNTERVWRTDAYCVRVCECVDLCAVLCLLAASLMVPKDWQLSFHLCLPPSSSLPEPKRETSLV